MFTGCRQIKLGAPEGCGLGRLGVCNEVKTNTQLFKPLNPFHAHSKVAQISGVNQLRQN